jgi:hypothetical protein
MKTLFFRCCFTCLIALIVLVVALQTAAQKKPLLENDRVKIFEQSGAAIQSTSSDNLKVVLLGTGVDPALPRIGTDFMTLRVGMLQCPLCYRSWHSEE